MCIRDSYWAIPAGDKNARGGKWEQGPGMDLFRDSLGYFPAAGFEITSQTFDLHKNEPDWNLRTEHELSLIHI